MNEAVDRVSRNRVNQSLWVLRALALGARQHRDIRRATGLGHAHVVEALDRLAELGLVTDRLDVTDAGEAVLEAARTLAPDVDWGPGSGGGS